jgi:hypothetical protein
MMPIPGRRVSRVTDRGKTGQYQRPSSRRGLVNTITGRPTSMSAPLDLVMAEPMHLCRSFRVRHDRASGPQTYGQMPTALSAFSRSAVAIGTSCRAGRRMPVGTANRWNDRDPAGTMAIRTSPAVWSERNSISSFKVLPIQVMATRGPVAIVTLRNRTLTPAALLGLARRNSSVELTLSQKWAAEFTSTAH